MRSFSWPDNKRAAVSLSFDDARQSQLDNGIPALDRHGVKATFYPNPAHMFKRVADWRAVAASGHEIGNHSMTHPCSGNFLWMHKKTPLELFTLERMKGELLDANRAIEETLGVRPVTFAYPCGHIYVGRGRTQRSYVPLVARHFLVGRGVQNGRVNLPRFCDLAFVSSFCLDDVTLKQAVELVDRAVDEGAWLIFIAHEVTRETAPDRLSRRRLEALCRSLNGRRDELWTDTVAAVGRYVKDTRGF